MSQSGSFGGKTDILELKCNFNPLEPYVSAYLGTSNPNSWLNWKPN